MKSKILLLIVLTFYVSSVMASGNVLIDGKTVKNKEDMQRILEKQLHFPTNYGKDLNNIYDGLLADFKSESVVRIKHLDVLRKKIGEQYIDEFIEVVGLAANDNLHVVLILE